MNETTISSQVDNNTGNNKNNNNNMNDNDIFEYMNGFNNEFHSEMIPNAIPKHRNNPKDVPYGLYTEQISGTSFTISPRHNNRRTWMYRIQPSVAGRTYDTNSSNNNNTHTNYPYFGKFHPKECIPTIEPICWNTPPSSLFSSSIIEESSKQVSNVDDNNVNVSYGLNFIDGMILMCTGGDMESMKHGLNIFMYTNVTKSMKLTEHICNTDGDFLIVPQYGTLIIHTELGRIHIQPTEIVVIPKGITFQIILPSEYTNDNDHDHDGGVRGYVLEIVTASGNGFQLPELGPIGTAGLANGRDFQIPIAWCAATSHEEYHRDEHIIYNKMSSQLIPCYLNHTPYNVIGWYGNYVPYKYNLHYFCTINSVSYDHIDPSIYTVLTCPSHIGGIGTALADFVIFPPRMIVTDTNTLRPPYFHKNTMSEYMGLIYGEYDAKVSNNNNNKSSGGFVPGGASLHNCMTPHGPDAISYTKAIQDPCNTTKKLDNGMAFMFETYLTLRVTPFALYNTEWRDIHYNECWQSTTTNNNSLSSSQQHNNDDDDGLSSIHFTGWDLIAKNTAMMKK